MRPSVDGRALESDNRIMAARTRTTRRRNSRPLRTRRRTISATTAARRFSEVVNRVCYQGEVFVVERGGAPVCEIGPPRAGRLSLGELNDVLRTLPVVDDAYWEAVAAAAAQQPIVPPSPWER